VSAAGSSLPGSSFARAVTIACVVGLIVAGDIAAIAAATVDDDSRGVVHRGGSATGRQSRPAPMKPRST
jgi:hypothetical protein